MMKSSRREQSSFISMHGHTGWRSVLPALLIVVTVWSYQSVAGLAWGDRGHRMINAIAIESLPQPLRTYFMVRRDYFVQHALDPDLLARDDESERSHHYTDLDADDSFPFLNFQRRFVVERAKPTSAELRHGDSVWQIERFTLRLADDFRDRRWEKADHDAVFAAHYAADLTQPLHTVLNYDGQQTGQTGIHSRFESELVNALAEGWRLDAGPAIFESDLRARTFEELTASFSCVNIIFASDHLAVAGRSYFQPQYFEEFCRLAGPLAKKRVEAGASFVSSLWYTAWVRAGKPTLPNRPLRGKRSEGSAAWGASRKVSK